MIIMRKKDVKHISLKRILVLGAITLALPAFTAVPVAAEETLNTVTLDDVEQKRKILEQAQKEYDMALAGKHAAEDLVENARRARDDAKEQYEIIMKKYKKGFAGFLQWVIDTEDDPLKIEDAQSTLALLQESGETDDISPASTRNITRMYFTAQWLEEYADFLGQYEDMGVTGTTSHLWMYHTQDISNDYSDFLEQNEDSYLTSHKSHRWKYNNEYQNEYEFFLGEGSWRDVAGLYFWFAFYTEDPTNNIDWKETGTFLTMPFQERSLGTFAEDWDGVPVLEHSQNEYKRTDTDPNGMWWSEYLYWANEGTYKDNGSNLIIGLCTLADPGSGENLSIDYLYEGDRMPYTLREYAQALRDYYALVDPLPFKAAWDGFEDDYTNSKKELKGAEELVSSALSRLKGAQKDYDEAVALFRVNTSLPEQSAADPVILTASEIAVEEPVYAGEEFSEAYAMAADNTSLSETASETEDEMYNEISPVSPAPATEKEESRSAGSGYAQPASTTTAFTYTDTTSKEESTKKPAEEENSILMRVMSYIFNGGAIAVIIPTGFRRRKKALGSNFI